MAERVTYTIPEPERSMFRALSAKTGVSEAELVRRFIRWACKLARVELPASKTTAAELAAGADESMFKPADVYMPAAGDSSGESLPESSVSQMAGGDSLPEYSATAGG